VGRCEVLLWVENVGVCIREKVWLENIVSQSEVRVDWGVRVRVQKESVECHNECDMYVYRQNTAMFISSTIA
jgi:hypothetical protein